MAPLIWGLAALAAGYGGYKAFYEDKPRFLGDLAKSGDGVQADLVAVQSVNPIPGGKPLVPPGATFIFVQVERKDKDNVYGPIVGTNLAPLPKPIRPSDLGLPSNAFGVPRSSITAIQRGGKTATAMSAGFHGEAGSRTFQG